MRSLSRGPRPGRSLLALCILLGGTAGPASAQQSITDVLTFLLTNRSIPTGDFVRDEQAAAETGDIISRFLSSMLRPFPSPRRREGSHIVGSHSRHRGPIERQLRPFFH